MGDLMEKPWVWALGALVVVLVLASSRRGGGVSNLTETNQIAAQTNVALSGIAASTAGAAYAYKTRLAELDYRRDEMLATGISASNATLLQREVNKGLRERAQIAASVASKQINASLAAVKSSNAVTLKLGQIAGNVRAKEIQTAPVIARIQENARAQTAIVTTQRLAARDERIAAYNASAAKAGYSSAATADMVGSAFEFAGGFI